MNNIYPFSEFDLKSIRSRRTASCCALAILALLAFAPASLAQNPTGVYTPVQLNSALPYRVEVRQYSMGATPMPTLHSYAVGEFEGKHLFVAGRTNGLHGFDCCIAPEENFPPQRQNRDLWVIDFENKQSWSRSLEDASSGLTEQQILSLSNTNNQFYQRNNTLYVTGGYGVNGEDDAGPTFGTFDTLSALNLPGLTDWVMGGGGTAAQHIRQLNSPTVKVTGGAMHEIGGRTHLVFGQDFDGVYGPFVDGAYTHQVRSFDIVDDGVNLSIANVSNSVPNENYRRRDLNIVPVIRPDGNGGLEQGLTALAGVFTEARDAWSVPVEIDSNGVPSMADPNDPNTFQQAMNVYHSAKLGFFSETRSEMHELLFGGITLDYLNPITQSIITDTFLPFTNDITSVVVDADGNYSQHHLGFFPEMFHESESLLRFGANAEFLPHANLPTFENGVIKFDELRGEVSLGYIFGGIVANAPHTRRDPGALSAGSNFVFEVVIFAVPEPSSMCLVALGCVGMFATSGRRRGR
jgi:hypothetical protein